MVALNAVASRQMVSTVAVAEKENPNLPIAVGRMLVLSFGLTVVVHSPSARERESCALTSTGRPKSTTHAGVSAAMKS